MEQRKARNHFFIWFNKPWIKFLAIFFSLIILFFVTMIASSALPTERVKTNADAGMKYIEGKGDYPNPFMEDLGIGTGLDLFTDNIMLDKAALQTNENMNVVQLAMDNGNYARYWNGYLIILKPLLEIFSYSQIKYLAMFVIFILFAYTIAILRQKLNSGIAFLFGIVTLAGFLILAAACIQYMTVYIIMMSTIIIVCKTYKPGEKSYLKWCYLFLTIGMVTNFFDLLTYPLLTLGMPLIVLFLLNLKYHEQVLVKRNIISGISCAGCWLAGYALTWVSKWILASAVLGRNVIIESIKQVFFRAVGDEAYPLNRLEMFHNNFSAYFFKLGNKTYVILAAILISFLLLYIFFRKPFKNLLAIIPFFAVGLFPIIWMLVLSNHSQIHVFFVYKILMLMPFALFSAAIYLIDWDKLKKRCKRKKLV